MGCEKSEVIPVANLVPINDPTKYTIEAGKHESTQSVFTPVEIERLNFRAKFDSSAIYINKDPQNQADINKLYGASDCDSFHHTNSARFGWRWFNSQLEIWAYTYSNGVRSYKYIDTVAFNTFNDYEIAFKDSIYSFTLNTKSVELGRSCKGPAKGYTLFPYFGGDETAPHLITLWLEDAI